jgi:hypothetical protein
MVALRYALEYAITGFGFPGFGMFVSDPVDGFGVFNQQNPRRGDSGYGFAGYSPTVGMW